ncbi:MucB/RseB C-terminal domain-containing protein [Marinobacter bohaiensis]|uniref:MucB/RseB C-terminal domain-containing protein n=1 Tax=Marinobacter bohaiensis TaxID=2201898 RepID=UPI000DADE94E|nr:MucB/RseB C-terminal domain-containing protein [Marinobacter bohaiensis]
MFDRLGSQSHHRLRWFLGLFVTWLAVSAQAADAPKTAEDWLEQLGPALNATSYKGVFVYSRGDQVSSMRIAHRFHDGEVQERLVIQDGDQGEIIRRGGRVFCILPSHGRIQLDAVLPSGPFSEAFSSKLPPFRRWYAARLLDDDRVAGHRAVVVALNPKDVHRYRYRLWLEKTSGLLVKSQVLANDDTVLERFQFTMLELTDDIPDSEFQIPFEDPRQALSLDKAEARIAAAPPPPEPSQPAKFAWSLGWHPEGFQETPSPHSHTGQAVAFSDGLASFSVFIAPVGNKDMPTGISRIGATTIFMRKMVVGDQRHLVTVVGEIPPDTAMKVGRSVFVQKNREPARVGAEPGSDMAARPQATAGSE